MINCWTRRGDAVMMSWEAPLMEAHADALCETNGDVMNVGFGLGIIDGCIQAREPRSHTIVEAHPDVRAHMTRAGWDSKAGVRVEFGRWQDVLPRLVEEGRKFDAIYFDTYGEEYDDMRRFHAFLPKTFARGRAVQLLQRHVSRQHFLSHGVQSRRRGRARSFGSQGDV